MIINKKSGQTDQLINYQSGLPDDEVSALATDQQGGLWISHGIGLSRALLALPLRTFSSYAGLKGTITTLYKQPEALYVGTTQGLFYLDEVKSYQESEGYIKKQRADGGPTQVVKVYDRGKESRVGNLINQTFGKKKKPEVVVTQANPQQPRQVFANPEHQRIYALESVSRIYRPVKGLPEKVIQIKAAGSDLLVATANGLYQVANHQARDLLPGQYVHDLRPALTIPDQFYAATDAGLFVLRRLPDQWKAEKIPGLPEALYTLTENASGLWAGGKDCVYEIRFNRGKSQVQRHPLANPYLEQILIQDIQNKITAFTSKSWYAYQPAKDDWREIYQVAQPRYPLIRQEGYTWIYREGTWQNLQLSSSGKAASGSALLTSSRCQRRICG
ncbi:MAG: hypothetical protein HC880_20260 [Bacteroidia bacterium]|nr:hypothetical protein [Bacteroidia bacterium]